MSAAGGMVSFPDPSEGVWARDWAGIDPLHLRHFSMTFPYTKTCSAILVYHYALAASLVSVYITYIAITFQHSWSIVVFAEIAIKTATSGYTNMAAVFHFRS